MSPKKRDFLGGNVRVYFPYCDVNSALSSAHSDPSLLVSSGCRRIRAQTACINLGSCEGTKASLSDAKPWRVASGQIAFRSFGVRQGENLQKNPELEPSRPTSAAGVTIPLKRGPSYPGGSGDQKARSCASAWSTFGKLGSFATLGLNIFQLIWRCPPAVPARFEHRHRSVSVPSTSH